MEMKQSGYIHGPCDPILMSVSVPLSITPGFPPLRGEART